MLRAGGFVWLLLPLVAAPCLAQERPRPSLAELVRQFESTPVFWQQFKIAEAIVAAGDASVLPRLEPWLAHQDRHLRGNAAFVFGRLGDRRGFDVIVDILRDRSERPEGQGFPSGWSVREQIRADRYYAAHLLGDLKDPRAVPILVPLLHDEDTSFIVPWSLGQIGGKPAIEALTGLLSDPDPNMVVLAAYSLAELRAREALPSLRPLLGDQRRCNFDKLETVGEAARAAIARIESGKVR